MASPLPPAGGAALLAASVADTLARLAARREQSRDEASFGRRCPVCSLQLTPPRCICGHSLAPTPSRHTVTVLINAGEVGRASSTHKLLLGSLRGSETAVWGTPECPSLEAVWDRVAAHCAGTSGRLPAILFPAPGAVSVGELMSGATPVQRAAGLHLIVVDGTWSQARAILRRPPSGATFCVVGPRQAYTLFGPARTQPGPGMLSTVEAVAVALDEAAAVTAAFRGAAQRQRRRGSHDGDGDGLHGVGNGEDSGDTASSPVWAPLVGWDACPVSNPESLLTPTTPAAAADNNPYSRPVMRPLGMPLLYPHAPRDVWANALRLRLMRMVDAVCAQCNKVDPQHCGNGYRTWHLEVHPPTGLWKAAQGRRGLAGGLGATTSGGGGSAVVDSGPHSVNASIGTAVVDSGPHSVNSSITGGDVAAAERDTPLGGEVAVPTVNSAGDGNGGSTGPSSTTSAAPLIFRMLPAFLLVVIAEFAYGPAAVLPNGYFSRHAQSRAWEVMVGADAAVPLRFAKRELAIHGAAQAGRVGGAGRGGGSGGGQRGKKGGATHSPPGSNNAESQLEGSVADEGDAVAPTHSDDEIEDGGVGGWGGDCDNVSAAPVTSALLESLETKCSLGSDAAPTEKASDSPSPAVTAPPQRNQLPYAHATRNPYLRHQQLRSVSYPPYTSTPFARTSLSLFFLMGGRFGPGCGWREGGVIT